MSRQSQVVIGVDIGGTNIKIVLVDPRGQRLLESCQLKTAADRGPDAVVADLSGCLTELGRESKKRGALLAAVGVGSAGLINLPNGVVVTSPNLPGWIDFPLGERLRQTLQVPVFVENDVNCICYGEYWLGAGRDLGDFVGIALGTGVGGCLVIDGRVWGGMGCSAGEIGHMTIQPEGEKCRCGNRGCLETLASASWLVRRTEDRLRQGVPSRLRQDLEKAGGLNPERIAQAARAGDELARELFHLAGSSLAIAAASVVHLLGIRGVLIAGGLANAWELFIGPLQDELKRRLTMIPWHEVRVVKGQLGDNAGPWGAAYLAASRISLL